MPNRYTVAKLLADRWCMFHGFATDQWSSFSLVHQDRFLDDADAVIALFKVAAEVKMPVPPPGTGWTSHGHAIPGLPQVNPRPDVARCGGPNLCQKCAHDVAIALTAGAPLTPA